jgi:hypothetical protein
MDFLLDSPKARTGVVRHFAMHLRHADWAHDWLLCWVNAGDFLSEQR